MVGVLVEGRSVPKLSDFASEIHLRPRRGRLTICFVLNKLRATGGKFMIRSMTGFGAAELGTEHGRLSAEIRSVNPRYCEISLRLPRSLSGLEGPVRQLLTARLARGKINLAVTWEGYEDAGG